MLKKIKKKGIRNLVESLFYLAVVFLVDPTLFKSGVIPVVFATVVAIALPYIFSDIEEVIMRTWKEVQVEQNSEKLRLAPVFDSIIIGIGGEKGSGKSTVAKYLESNGYFHTYFAKRLKNACREAFAFTDEEMEDQIKKEALFDRPLKLTRDHVNIILSSVTPHYPGKITQRNIDKMYSVADSRVEFSSIRKTLQFIGTELLRDCISPDFHLMCVKKELVEAEKAGHNRFVLSDARFPNEREATKAWGGYTCLVVDTSPKVRVSPAAQKDGHASENSLGNSDDYDFVIINGKSSFVELFQKVSSMVYKIHLDRV